MRENLLSQRFKKTLRSSAVVIDTQVSKHKGSHQPTPDGSLMISAVALAGAASIVSLVSVFLLSKAAKAMRREQAARANIHDSFLLFRRKRALWQRHRKNLIGPERGIVAETRVIDHVIAAASCLVPESREVFASHGGQVLKRLCGCSSDGRELTHGLQCV